MAGNVMSGSQYWKTVVKIYKAEYCTLVNHEAVWSSDSMPQWTSIQFREKPYIWQSFGKFLDDLVAGLAGFQVCEIPLRVQQIHVHSRLEIVCSGWTSHQCVIIRYTGVYTSCQQQDCEDALLLFLTGAQYNAQLAVGLPSGVACFWLLDIMFAPLMKTHLQKSSI